MPHLRRKLRVSEVSLCASPANPGARVALFKAAVAERKKDQPMFVLDISKIDFSNIEDEEVRKAVQEGIGKIFDSANDVLKASEEAKAVAEKAAEDALADYEDLKKEVETKKGKGEGGDKINKDELDPKVRAHIEKMEAESAEAKKASDEQAERIAKLEDIRKTEQMEAVAKGYTSLALDLKKVVPLLKSLSDDDLGIVKEVFAAANEQVKASKAFESIGAGGDADENSSLGQLNSLAKSRVDDTRKAGRSMTFEQAFSEVSKENPELKQAERQEARETRAARVH